MNGDGMMAGSGTCGDGRGSEKHIKICRRREQRKGTQARTHLVKCFETTGAPAEAGAGAVRFEAPRGILPRDHPPPLRRGRREGSRAAAWAEADAAVAVGHVAGVVGAREHDTLGAEGGIGGGSAGLGVVREDGQVRGGG